MTEKFRKQPAESVLMKGNLNYSVGEPGIKNYFTGKFRVTECTVFLTNQRLVATRARKYGPPFGPLVWLIRAFFPRTIVFSIGLHELAAIRLDPARRKDMILETAGGQQFALNSATIFNKQPQWLAAITRAVSESAPGITAQQTETAVTFRRSSGRAVA
jgi:hypothetical protein